MLTVGQGSQEISDKRCHSCQTVCETHQTTGLYQIPQIYSNWYCGWHTTKIESFDGWWSVRSLLEITRLTLSRCLKGWQIGEDNCWCFAYWSEEERNIRHERDPGTFGGLAGPARIQGEVCRQKRRYTIALLLASERFKRFASWQFLAIKSCARKKTFVLSAFR